MLTTVVATVVLAGIAAAGILAVISGGRRSAAAVWTCPIYGTVMERRDGQCEPAAGRSAGRAAATCPRLCADTRQPLAT